MALYRILMKNKDGAIRDITCDADDEPAAREVAIEQNVAILSEYEEDKGGNYKIASIEKVK